MTLPFPAVPTAKEYLTWLDIKDKENPPPICFLRGNQKMY